MGSDSKDARGFRARIAELRNARGLTQAKLSESVDRDNGYISRVETGEIEWPPLEQLSKIAAALDVPLLEIFNSDGMADSEEELRSRIGRMIATADLATLRKYFRILLIILKTAVASQKRRCFEEFLGPMRNDSGHDVVQQRLPPVR